MTDAYPYHDRHKLIQQIQQYQQERQLSSVDYNHDDWPSSIKDDDDESAGERYGDDHSPQHEERRAGQGVGGKIPASHHHPAPHPDPPSRLRSHTLMTDDDKRMYTESAAGRPAVRRLSASGKTGSYNDREGHALDAESNRRLELIRQLNQRAEEEFKRRTEAEEDEKRDGEEDEDEETEEEKRRDRWDVLDNDTEDYEDDSNVTTNFYVRRDYEKTRRKKDKNKRIRSRDSGDVRRRRQVSEPQRPHYPPGPHYPPAPHSEPAYSREVTPGKALNRASSLPPLLAFDDASSTSNNNEDDSLTSARTAPDDPGAFFDRYARRATRASVLTKAEQLLLRRQSRPLTNISESDDEDNEAATMRSQRTHAQRHAARHPRRQKNDEEFEEQDNEEEEEEENSEKENSVDEDDVTDGGKRYAVAAGRPRMYDTKGKMKERTRTLGHDRFRKNRLRQANARIQRQRQRLPYSKAAAQSFSDYDRESSGTDDDVTEYGGYDGDGRYEVSQTRLPEAVLFSQDHDRDRDQTKKPRRVWVYRNADENFKGKQVLITQKEFPNFETLLVKLGNIVPTVAGVRYIFSWPEGKEIKSITELQNNRFYVCSSVNRLQRVNYGNSREHFWKGGKIRHNEKHLFTKENGQHVTQSPSNQRPHVITVISNMYRDSREKLILNPNTSQNFEDVLQDLQNMVFIPHPPVRALWTEEKPHIKVEGFSHLFRELKDHKTFLVCGEEREPREPRELREPAKRTLPSSNSSSDSVTGKRSLRRSKQAKADTARLDSLSPIRRGPAVAKRTEPLRVEINGRQRDFFLPSMPALENDGLKPDKKLRLDWVYGFRGRDVRQNLVVLPNTGELVYFVAAIVVLYDRRTHTQKHYTAHTEEVTCLAIHPRDPFIASGQLAGRDPAGSAHVRIWHGITMSTQAVIGVGVFQQGVACISFSEKDSNGDLLMTIDESDRHVMSVWDWQRETLVAKTTTTNDPVVLGCFYQFDDSILITFGKQHMYFWTVFWKRSESRILRDKKSGLFEDEIPKFVTAVCFGVNGEVITGDSTGSILVWQRDDANIFTIDRQVSASMKEAHKKSISSLVLLSDGVLLSGGGSEIKAWDSLMRFKLMKERVLPEMYGSVRTVVPQTSNGKDGFLFIGTSKNIILEGSLQQKFRPIVQGHCEELWAVTSHPSEPAFYTAGHDMSVMKWSALSHAIIWSTRDKKPCTSIAVDSRGQIVAVGTTSGKVTLYSAKNGEETQSVKVGAAQINAISFSPVFSDPNGRQIAVGTHDGFLHLLVLNGEGELYRHQSASLGQQNPAFVMHLDWSSDGRFIQTVLGNYELVFWDSQTMQRLKSGRTLRDAEWASYTVPVGYPLIGSWQHMERGEVVNVACRSYFHDFIVTGDSRGRLRLFKYPCTVAKAEFREVKPFSSNTTAAVLLADDTHLLTSGGSDAALMQYSLVDR